MTFRRKSPIIIIIFAFAVSDDHNYHKPNDACLGYDYEENK